MPYKPGEFARLTKVIQQCNARIAKERALTASIMKHERELAARRKEHARARQHST